MPKLKKDWYTKKKKIIGTQIKGTANEFKTFLFFPDAISKKREKMSKNVLYSHQEIFEGNGVLYAVEKDSFGPYPIS